MENLSWNTEATKSTINCFASEILLGRRSWAFCLMYSPGRRQEGSSREVAGSKRSPTYPRLTSWELHNQSMLFLEVSAGVPPCMKTVLHILIIQVKLSSTYRCTALQQRLDVFQFRVFKEITINRLFFWNEPPPNFNFS